ncbi:pyridine nucleotide-disulfide oxidoreductase [Mycetocola zhadangensis]|nr:pyridine nucleotide-disulfide oxidoreductase [Mycetocola zhadangensis]
MIIVGGGFAGVACARELSRRGIRTLIFDKNSYHQFQPLLYQVAASQIGVSEVTRPLRAIFHRTNKVKVFTAEVASIDTANHSVTTTDGHSYRARVLVLANGAEPNFFDTPGAREHTYPLYSVRDATRLGTALVAALNTANNEPEMEHGVRVVVVGGGPTGVEIAGAIAENFRYIVPGYFSPEVAEKCSVHLVDMLPNLLTPFDDKSKAYAVKRLTRMGVKLKLGSGVTEVTPGSLTFADGAHLPADIVVWAGGLKAGKLVGDSGLSLGRGGRVDVTADLKAPGAGGVYVLGDTANMTDARGNTLPQLGSSAQQAGKWAARNIAAELTGNPTKPFKYVDKGYMAMIGRGAAVAELGPKRRLVHGPIAFAAWLAVHLVLLSGWRQRASALFSWAEDFLSHSRSHVVLGRAD